MMAQSLRQLRRDCLCSRAERTRLCDGALKDLAPYLLLVGTPNTRRVLNIVRQIDPPLRPLPSGRAPSVLSPAGFPLARFLAAVSTEARAHDALSGYQSARTTTHRIRRARI
jgi:hypothetical protein